MNNNEYMRDNNKFDFFHGPPHTNDHKIFDNVPKRNRESIT